jgi:hypothetical protein
VAPLAYAHDRNFGCRLREFVYRGHRCVSMENARVRTVIAADKGADILELLYKPLDVECLWRSRSGLRVPELVRFSSPLSTGHFREYFAGGWYEMLPSGPGPCIHRGAEFGFHGEATFLPWDYRIERDDPDEVRVRFWTRTFRLPLLIERVLSLRQGSTTLTLDERLVSEAAHEVECFWGHHPTLGWPLIDEGTQVFLPRCTAVVPDAPPPGTRFAAGQRGAWPTLRAADGQQVDLSVVPSPATASFQDVVRLEDLAEGWYAVVNGTRGVGFALRWDRAVFPLLAMWHLWGGPPDYPWYGTPYLLTLEPLSDLPSLATAAARGTALTLQPGRAVETTLEATLFESPLAVTQVGPGGDVR